LPLGALEGSDDQLGCIVPLFSLVFPLVSMDRTVPSPNINTSYTSVHCVEASRARRLNETDARHGSSVELEPRNYSAFFLGEESIELFDAMQIITWGK